MTALCASLSCGSPGGSSGQPVTTQFIDAAMGGTASTPNGRLKVQIPKGALTMSSTITIQTSAPAAGTVGPVYEIGPTGTQFLQPATLSIGYTNADLAGISPDSLKIATLAKGSWVPIASSVDFAANAVTGQITHLSPWSLIVYNAVVPPNPDAGSGGAAGSDAGGASGEAGGAGGNGQGGAAGGGGGATGGGGGGATGGGGTSGAAGGTGGAGQGGSGGGAAGGSGQGGTGGAAGSSGQGGSGQDAAADVVAPSDAPADDAAADAS